MAHFFLLHSAGCNSKYLCIQNRGTDATYVYPNCISASAHKIYIRGIQAIALEEKRKKNNNWIRTVSHTSFFSTVRYQKNKPKVVPKRFLNFCLPNLREPLLVSINLNIDQNLQ